MTPPKRARFPLHIVLRAFLLMCLPVAFQGCAGVPSWLDKVPVEKGAVYAVGHGDPGYWTNPIDEARKRARVEIGRTVKSEVKQVLIVEGVGSGDYAEEVSTTFSDTMISGTKVLEMWYDKNGVLEAEGRLYVLMKFEKNAFVKQLAETGVKVAKQKSQSISPAKIEEAANKAFDELDKAIDQKNKGYEQLVKQAR